MEFVNAHSLILIDKRGVGILGTVTRTVEIVYKDVIDAFLEERDCPIKTQMQIDLSLEEMFVNIANYAYPDGNGEAEILVSEDDGVVTITLIDGEIAYVEATGDGETQGIGS